MRVGLRELYSSRRPEIVNITISLSFMGSPMLAKASEYSCARVRYSADVSSGFISILSNWVLRVYSREDV
ncbi:hypothetical protein Hanom_Chr11g00992171 [Helianthus anomalus]